MHSNSEIGSRCHVEFEGNGDCKGLYQSFLFIIYVSFEFIKLEERSPLVPTLDASKA